MLKRLLSKLSGRPAISTQDRQAIVAYLTDELKIAVFKDMEASRFYGHADMASGSARLLQAAADHG